MVKGVEWPVWQQLLAILCSVLVNDNIDDWLVAAADDYQDIPENKENAEFARHRMSGLVESESRSEVSTENYKNYFLY